MILRQPILVAPPAALVILCATTRELNLKSMVRETALANAHVNSAADQFRQ